MLLLKFIRWRPICRIFRNQQDVSCFQILLYQRRGASLFVAFQSIFDSSFTLIILSICILALRDLRYFQILSDCSGYCSAIVPLSFHLLFRLSFHWCHYRCQIRIYRCHDWCHWGDIGDNFVINGDIFYDTMFFLWHFYDNS